jgi:predicted nucleic acid-binding protein
LNVVLDADVLVGALDGSDAHHAVARRLFARWRGEDARLSISVVNLSEVLVAPAADRRRLHAARQAIAALGIVPHQAPEPVAVEASRLRGRHPISLPDAYCLATARHIGGAVASFDRKVVRAAESEQIPRATHERDRRYS